MARHEQNRRQDTLSGLSIEDANAAVAKLAAAGIPASVFSLDAMGPAFLTDEGRGVEVIVAPAQRAEALRILGLDA